MIFNKNCLARKVYIVITALFTVVVLAFGYLYTEQQRQMLTQQKVLQLTNAAVLLEQQFSQRGFAEMIQAVEDKSLTSGEKVAILNRRYQPVLDSVASLFPEYKLGIFSRKLGRVVAMNPGVVGDFPVGKHPAEIWSVYDSGKIEVFRLPAVPEWSGKPMLSVQCPINLEGQIIGHTWASVKIEDVERQIFLTVVKIGMLCFLIWLITFIAVSLVFTKLINTSKQLAEEIGEDKETPATIEDFPELIPILDTVNEMRRRYCGEAQKLKQLMEICPVGIIVIDNSVQIVAANQLMREKYSELTGWDIVGCSFKQLTEHSGFIFDNSVASRALQGEAIKDCCMTMFGEEWLVNAVPLVKSGSQETIGALIVSQNITNHERSRSDKHKLDRDHLVSCMATGVAHEIRNPLTVIKGYLQFFRRKTASFEQINIILEELERVEAIITEFLTLARNKNTEKRRQNLNEVISQIYPILSADALEQGVELKVELAPNLPELFIDGKEIKQLVFNLVRNSLEAMGPTQGRIVVATEAENQKVYLRVSDNGCGIPQEQQSRIFDPFYTTKENGTGLGLAVSASIVQRHGGRIEIKSSAGMGTLVTIGFTAFDGSATA